MITIWQGITIQGLYCYLDMGNDTVMYYKCSHVPNLVNGHMIYNLLSGNLLYIYIFIHRHLLQNDVLGIVWLYTFKRILSLLGRI